MFGDGEQSNSVNHLFEIDATLLRLTDLASKIRALSDDGGVKGVIASRRGDLRVKGDRGKFTS